jgi:hypothetical protein
LIKYIYIYIELCTKVCILFYINVTIISVLIIFSAKQQRKTKAVWERNCYASMTEEEGKQNYSHRKMKKDALCP